jgi:hypothetical protein
MSEIELVPALRRSRTFKHKSGVLIDDLVRRQYGVRLVAIAFQDDN